MKRKTLLLSLVCILAFLLTTCSQPTLQTNTQVAEQTPEADTLPATKSVNNIDVEFTGYTREGAYLTANVCIEPPDKLGRWHPDDILLVIENQEVQYSSMVNGFISHRSDGFLCSSIEFPVGVHPDLGKVELIIGHIKTDVQGNQDCEKAQKNLDDANSGIVIECYTSPNSFMYSIVKMPATMNEEEAYKLSQDAFSDIVEGPWMFIFLVPQP